ncbi:MAG: hypothetical protein WBW94_06745 [Anaerolineales bacterium]
MDAFDMIDDGNLRDEIYANMQLKTTDELLRIWEENDHEEWTPLAFDLIKQILFQRTGVLPDVPVFHKNIGKQVKNKTFIKHPKNKLLQITGIAYVVIFIMFIIFNPTGENGHNNIIGDLCILGIGIGFAIMSVFSSYRAWTMDSKSYRRWTEDQAPAMPTWLKKFGQSFSSLYPDWFVLWSARLVYPLFYFLGLLFSCVGLILLITLFR